MDREIVRGHTARRFEVGDRVFAYARALDAYVGVTHLYHFVESSARQLAQLADMFERGQLAVHVQQTYRLEQAAQAPHTRGRLVTTLGACRGRRAQA
jgi:NADPH:quinone reductase-like Zn-dependent oxidoreductase